MMTKATLIAGARPNFMKVAPLWRCFREQAPDIRIELVHTGQHYDKKMSDVFFRDLNIPAPDRSLGIGSGSHAEQTARCMMALEPVLVETRPDVVIVVGDVNSTVAAALTAAKLHIPVAHVEAGLRSRDRAMPEELNRLATDVLSDFLFTSCRDADENLVAEGIPKERIHFVGNIMIDSLVSVLPKVRESRILAAQGLEPGRYVCVTLHRPSNVDDPANLASLLNGLLRVSKELPVVFPVHPRTRKRVEDSGWDGASDRCRLLDPIGYLDFMKLMSEAAAVVTDSGGIQEETSYLGIPCLTVRHNTERPVTITHGTNRLVEPTGDALAKAFGDIQSAPPAHREIELWDGHTAERIVSILIERL